ncbi:hypothetical protein B0T19DRAFT_101104 [Cercophora scortea]|uniref:Wax synthase domain-containing protein n=1 Tax=Cercophora scortea TaxID=314031 RepID=A0AAE0IWB5_9PEZI|nr:hypothetical protein B0T19DRAFT_101104 [Cercophora scortea]
MPPFPLSSLNNRMDPPSPPPAAITVAPHTFLSVLPHILLLLVVTLGYFPPPFRGRGLLFVVIVTILQWQCFAAPWPANDGDTRAARYGLGSAWLIILPVAERLLINTPERDFWRVGSDEDLAQPQRQQQQGNDTKRSKDAPREFSLGKIWYSLVLFSTPRAIGWNFGTRRLNAERIEKMKTRRAVEQQEKDDENATVTTFPRAAFVATKFVRAFACYLVWDAIVLAERKATFPANMQWAWDKDTLGQIAWLDFLMLLTTYVGMTMQFELVAGVGVGLFLSQPEDWPPLFGDITTCSTIAAVWGKFWHQYIRQPCLGFSHFIIHKLHIPTHSRLAYLIHLVTAFFISAFFHCVAVGAMAPGFYPLKDVIRDFAIFFGLQPVGTMFERLVMDLFSQWRNKWNRKKGDAKKKQQQQQQREDAARTQASQEETSLLAAAQQVVICGGERSGRGKYLRRVLSALFFRVVGYVWVVCWFYVTGWWFVRPYVGVGVVNWDLPYSILSKLLIPGK